MFNNTVGIYVLNSLWSGIYDSVVYNNEEEAIEIKYSSNITVGNVSSSNNVGVGVSIRESGNITVSKCICTHNRGTGFIVYGGDIYTGTRISICNNTVVHNEEYGIGTYGYSLMIKNNTAAYNGERGIYAKVGKWSHIYEQHSRIQQPGHISRRFKD